ncbi:MAG: hypothetical protein GTN71_28080 [Anaerolineae bacterium]|nr:hypothetical protein [Anaerolineae bacterium]
MTETVTAETLLANKPMPDPRIIEIEKLIADYEVPDKDTNEANVEAAFVARLFDILGWAKE